MFRPERGFGGLDQRRFIRTVAASDLGPSFLEQAASVYFWMELSGRGSSDIQIRKDGKIFVRAEITFDTTIQAETFDDVIGIVGKR